MIAFPPEVRHELEGWSLFWADLDLAPCPEERRTEVRREAAAGARQSHRLETLAEHPPVAAMRRLFREVGCDPTRYRPASEALLRRLLKGEELPAIHPLVDLANCLSAKLAVPVCIMDREKLHPPFVWRAGRAGESMLSLRGPFDLEARPLLLDREGPCDVPISGGDRVKVTRTTTRAWLVAYLPRGVVAGERAETALHQLLAAAPVAELRGTAVTPPDQAASS